MIKEGIINLYKPTGMTSHDCINFMRRLTGIKRIGHTGTLDPMASGVLPICMGTAARVCEYMDMDFKTYLCEMILGIETETQDIWGEPLVDNREMFLKKQAIGEGFSEERIRTAFLEFDGEVEQLPPKYSALKVNGKRLYEYARAGLDVEIKTRKIFIKQMTIKKIDLKDLRIVFEVTCSKGTYIRSICRSVGENLGCGGTMSALERLGSGVFTKDDSITMEELAALRTSEDIRDPKTRRYISYGRADVENFNRFVLPVDYPLIHFGKVLVNSDRVKWFLDGGHIALWETEIICEPEFKDEESILNIREEYKNAYNLYGEIRGKQEFLGVAFYSTQYKKLVADKVFFRNY